MLATALAAFALLLLLSATGATVFAHGGEDHGEEKASVVSTNGNMIVRTARAGELEVTVKHAPIEPDRETATARVFVTRFDTNEPVGNAKVTLLFTGGSGALVELTAAAAGSAAGMYEAKLPPFPRGEYKFSARVEGGGEEPHTAEYGALKVVPVPPAAAESGSSWARTALIVFGSLIGLCIVGIVLYRATRIARHNQTEKRNERETATA